MKRSDSLDLNQAQTFADFSIHKENPFINPLLAHLKQKSNKHQAQADFILSSLITPFQAFKEGCEQAIASYIKLGNEGIKTHQLVAGPQIKSSETILMEEIAQNLLKDYDSVRFIEKNDHYYACANGKIYPFSKLIQGVNFNHLTLSQKEISFYHTLIESNAIKNKPYLCGLTTQPTEQDFIARDLEGLCDVLSFPEKEAVNIYTGNYYQVMNFLMRGDIDQAILHDYHPASYTRSEKINATLKEALVHIVIAISALNKLPDFNTIDSNGRLQKYLYRLERSLPEKEIAKRKKAILEGGKTTLEMGFLSAASEYPAEAFLNDETQFGILFKNLKGKKITPLSQFGTSEREVLIPPTQVQWLYYKEILNERQTKEMTLFIAKPVTVPLETPTIENEQAKQIWIAKQSDNFLYG